VVESGDDVLKNQIEIDGSVKILVCNFPVNEQRYINKFFEATNKIICPSSLLIGRVILLEHKKHNIYKRLPMPLGHIVYFIYCVLHRILPKLPHVKKVYFSLTKGRLRAVSKIEIIGRLYSCGYKLTGMQNSQSEFWFVAQKVGLPDYNSKVSYGPLIKLKRRGLYNEYFYVYKFRTMFPYSEYLQEFVYSNYGIDSGGKFRDDPRVTSLGKILRKYWIDEIPMLWNILKRDMKIVGVRPLSSHYFSLYPDSLQKLRGRVRPGLLPPFYADLPVEFDDICKSEEKYLKSYLKHPIKTDLVYLVRIFKNIVIKRARSK
jgi:lipopolysaccharide/colanic/teichoic acid biosynthesis glycosyltransferase